MEQVPFTYWLRPEAPGAFVDLSPDGAASMEEAQRWWIASAIATVAFLCAVCIFAWWHQYRLRAVFRAEADSLDEGRNAPQLTLEESYQTMAKDEVSPAIFACATR